MLLFQLRLRLNVPHLWPLTAGDSERWPHLHFPLADPSFQPHWAALMEVHSVSWSMSTRGKYVSPLGQGQLFLHTRLWNRYLEWHWRRMVPTTVPQQQQQLVPPGRAGRSTKVDSNVSTFYILFLVVSQTFKIKITHFIMENFSIYESTEQCVCIVWIHSHQLSRQGLTLPTCRCLTVNNPDVLCNPAGLWCKSVLARRVLYSKVGCSIFVTLPQAWGPVRHSLVEDAILNLCSS